MWTCGPACCVSPSSSPLLIRPERVGGKPRPTYDTLLRCSGRHVICAHSAFLIAQSPYLRKKISSARATNGFAPMVEVLSHLSHLHLFFLFPSTLFFNLPFSPTTHVITYCLMSSHHIFKTFCQIRLRRAGKPRRTRPLRRPPPRRVQYLATASPPNHHTHHSVRRPRRNPRYLARA